MALTILCMMFTGLVWYSIYQENQINKLRQELARIKKH